MVHLLPGLRCSILIGLAPISARAVDFSGPYVDPNHPHCLRNIQVVGATADVRGTDGSPGCPPDGTGQIWSVVGEVDGDTILVDFSPKGGPADLRGAYESSPIPGIRWPDGNLWSRAPISVSGVDFSGSYADPNHPNCLRNIQVAGTQADVSGTDGSPGCPPDGSGEAWDLVGEVNGETIAVDFSPKGGPADLRGTYESSPIPGIRWLDGNLWSKAPISVSGVDFSGSYADPNHPHCLRKIQVAGTQAEVSGTDGAPGCPPDGRGEAWDLVGEVHGDTILVDFSPKGGPADLRGTYESSPIPGIRWPDGNLWSRESVPVSSGWTAAAALQLKLSMSLS